jgi:hypothetical protein
MGHLERNGPEGHPRELARADGLASSIRVTAEAVHVHGLLGHGVYEFTDMLGIFETLEETNGRLEIAFEMASGKRPKIRVEERKGLSDVLVRAAVARRRAQAADPKAPVDAVQTDAISAVAMEHMTHVPGFLWNRNKTYDRLKPGIRNALEDLLGERALHTRELQYHSRGVIHRPLYGFRTELIGILEDCNVQVKRLNLGNMLFYRVRECTHTTHSTTESGTLRTGKSRTTSTTRRIVLEKCLLWVFTEETKTNVLLDFWSFVDPDGFVILTDGRKFLNRVVQEAAQRNHLRS